MPRSLSQERHEIALAAAGMGVWDWNISANTLHWDASLFDLFGVDRGSFTGTLESWSSLLHPEDAAQAQTDVKRSLDTGETFRSFFRIVRPLDGVILHLGAAGTVLLDEAGKPVRMVGVNWDRTEQVKMEQEVARSQVFIDSIINTISDPIFVKDPEHRWIFFNHAFCEMLGKKPAELLGKSDYDIFPKEMADHFWRVDDEVFRERREIEVEEPIINTGGETRYLLTKKKPIFDAGRSEKMLVGVIRDITERRRSEQELKKSQRALLEQSKMAALGQMAGGIAHEINNPLAAVRGRLYIMRLGLEGKDKPAPEQLLGEIQTVDRLTVRISEIVSALKVFSRKDSETSLEPLPLHEVVREVASVCTEKLRKCDCALENLVPKDAIVLARRVDLMQILVNLINNSCDAVEALPQRWIRIAVAEHLGEAVLSVTDCGAGIPENVSKRMMEPFFTTKDVGKGTGLGLSISRSLAENMSGSLQFDASCPNTRFVLKLSR